MTQVLSKFAMGLTVVISVGAATAQRVSADGAAQTLNYVTDRYFEQVYFKFSPTGGTAAGLKETRELLAMLDGAGG